MADKLMLLLPEMWLFAGVVVVAILGLSPAKVMRDRLPLITGFFLLVAMIAVPFVYTEPRVSAAGLLMPMLGKYVKMIVCGVSIGLALISSGIVDRRYEAAMEAGRATFDPLRANRGEFYSFFLLSVIGVLLCCNANDLIWLFLALELTSLPTYIMVAMGRDQRQAQEAAVKYFFLGAMAAAMFLYGFALLYGATGTIVLTEMRQIFAEQAASGGISRIGIIGMIIALLGVSFKIAAAPMHFYAADVYEGAAAPVTAFLGFIPKTAGMLAMILLLGTIGWGSSAAGTGLPQPILTMLWMVAVLTMTLGNVGALLQSSVKRMLAYSSIAHSGYMLIGIIAGPENGGLNAVLFYLLAYGIMNTAAFTVLAGLERNSQEIESMEDLAGLRLRHPAMAVVMAVSAGSLLGFPPLLGFVGKLYLFFVGIEAEQVPLVVIAALNSAISAWYYLRLMAMPVLARPSARSETITPAPTMWPRVVGIVGAILVVLTPLFAEQVFRATGSALDGYQAAAPSSQPPPDDAPVLVSRAVPRLDD